MTGMPLTQFLLNVISTLQKWLGIAAILFLLYGAYLVWSSGDNPGARAHAYRHLTSVAAGLVLVIFAKDIVRMVYTWAGMAAPF